VSLDAETFTDLVHGGAAAAAPTRHTGSAKFAGPDRKVRVHGERYVVATSDALGPPPAQIDGRARDGGSYAEAEEARASWATSHAAQRDELLVVGKYEMSAP
jgi:hypothetical protein